MLGTLEWKNMSKTLRSPSERTLTSCSSVERRFTLAFGRPFVKEAFNVLSRHFNKSILFGQNTF